MAMVALVSALVSKCRPIPSVAIGCAWLAAAGFSGFAYSHAPFSTMSVFAATRMASALRVSPVTVGQQQLRLISSSAVANKLPLPTRNVPVNIISDEQDLKQLNEKRNERPISPHLSIYQPQLTWYSSMCHRITGGALGVGIYTAAIAYAAAPLAGFDALSTTSVVDFVHQFPEWAKYAVKAPFAAMFSFHFFNGLRHLSWDSGRCTCFANQFSISTSRTRPATLSLACPHSRLLALS